MLFRSATVAADKAKAVATTAADKAKTAATTAIDAVKAKLPKKDVAEADFVEEIVCEEPVVEDVEEAVAAAACECEA